jgi:uncharacterized protein
MSSRLPETLDFLKQAERRVSLEGLWPLAELNRFCDTLNDTSGELAANLFFGSSAGFYCLQGTVRASVEVICQRCAEPMQQELLGHFKLGLVTSDEKIGLLPPDMEPYLVEGEEQSIIDVLEDELLLLLPMVMTHQSECSEFLQKQNEQRRTDEVNDSPFAALKDLKKDLKKD